MHCSWRLIVQTLVFSRSYLHRQVSPPETLVVKGGTTWARNGRRNLPENARLPSNIQGSFICRKSTTWDKRLYLPSEGRPGLNPRTWVPKASMLPLDHRSRLTASFNKLQIWLHNTRIALLKHQLRIRDAPHKTSSQHIANEALKWRGVQKSSLSCDHSLIKGYIQPVINYDAFSLFDKLSLSSQYILPTFIIVLNTVHQTHRPPARHYNTCSR